MASNHRIVVATLQCSKEKLKRKQFNTRIIFETLKYPVCMEDMRSMISTRLEESQVDHLESEWKKYNKALT